MKLKDGKSYNRLAHSQPTTCYSAVLREMTRCQLHQMFRVENLPDTIPEYVFIRNAISSGWQWVTELDGKLISFTGDDTGGSGLGPGYDYNYLPTHIVVTNPYLNPDGSIPDYTPQTVGGYSKTMPISDGVLVKSNSELMSLESLIAYFSDLEDTAATTLKMSLYITRMALNWLSKSDNDHQAMEAYIDSIISGKLAVAHTEAWTEEDMPSLAVGANAGSATLLKSQIEALQYIRGYKWQSFGVQSNHNMKRESINESEAGMNENSLLPLIDDMYANLKAGIDEINERYGTNITIRYNSAWEEVQEQTDETEDANGNESGADDTDVDDSGRSDGTGTTERDAGEDVDEPERREED